VDLLIALARYRRMLLVWPLVATVTVGLISFIVPKTFTATTRTLVPQQGQSTAAAMLNQLSGLASLAAGGGNPLKNPGDLYIQMLRSDTVTDALIQRFGLLARYDARFVEDARRRLLRDAQFTADRSGIMTIEVDARDPKLAADMANAFVEELYKLTSTLAVTEASQRRLFFERQLEQVKEKLADAEVELRRAMDAGGLVSVDLQSRAAIETIARLRASISAKEVQIGAMSAYAASTNPEIRRAETELASMKRELQRLETGSDAAAVAPGGPKAGKVTASGVRNIRLLRDVKYHETLFEVLAKQYEIARLDESKEAPVIQVIDKATPPERKSKPRRAEWCAAAFAAGLAAAVIAAMVRQIIDGTRGDPARRGKLEALRLAWVRRESRP
jgi:uncharacterized protein involved in exopolysaccharide biosynthesis